MLLFVVSGSVDDIIDHYKNEQIVEGYNLKEAVSVQVSPSASKYYVIVNALLNGMAFTSLSWPHSNIAIAKA